MLFTGEWEERRFLMVLKFRTLNVMRLMCQNCLCQSKEGLYKDVLVSKANLEKLLSLNFFSYVST